MQEVADPNAEGLELLDDGAPREEEVRADEPVERRVSRAEGKAVVRRRNMCVRRLMYRAPIFSMNEIVFFF